MSDDDTLILMHTGVMLWVAYLARNRAHHCALPAEEMARCTTLCNKVTQAQRLLDETTEVYNWRRCAEPTDPIVQLPLHTLTYEPSPDYRREKPCRKTSS